MDDRSKMLKKLSAYAFAAYDWNLYLDTHPEDTQAIAMFKKMTDKAKELKREFSEKYGPLTAAESNNSDFWEWIEDPWPWDNI